MNLLGLTIGITCTILISLWVKDELTYDKFHANYSSIYKMYANRNFNNQMFTDENMVLPLASNIEKSIPQVKQAVVTTHRQPHVLKYKDKLLKKEGYTVSEHFFDMFTWEFINGNPKTALPDAYAIVLTQSCATALFGNEDPINKVIKVDNEYDAKVTAIVADVPGNSTLQFDFINAFNYAGNYLSRAMTNWTNSSWDVYVQVNPGSNMKAVEKAINDIKYQHDPDDKRISTYFAFPFSKLRLESEFKDGKNVGGLIEYVRLFSIIAVIILLIACVNFMNLSTARSEKRAREVGVRKVLGAGKKILVAQFIGEAMVMAFLSLIVAVIIISIALPAFNNLVEKKLVLGLDDPFHIFSLLLIGLVCGLVAGSYPSLYLSSFNPIGVFKGLNLKGSGAAYIRKGLVVVQFTISIILIISTIIVYNQIQHIKGRDLGYNKENVIQTGLRGQMEKNFAVIKNQLLTSGYVENVAMSNLNQLYMGSSTGDFTWDGKDPSKQVLVTQDIITPEYINTMGINIIKGRDFYPDAKQDSSSVIINETFAKIIGKQQIIGTVLRRDTTSFTIVGVVKDFVFGDMYAKSDPLLFQCYPDYFGYMYIKLKQQANVENAVARIESVIKSNNPGYPFNYIFMDDEFDRQFRSEALIGKLSRIFALLAIVITCLGLFGLAAYTAERRTKEIGIRKVLGASIPGITGLIAKEFVKLVIISSLISFPFAWWFMHNWLQDYAYRTQISWWVFAIAAALALLIAVFTISFQAIKAALANPVKSLRTE